MNIINDQQIIHTNLYVEKIKISCCCRSRMHELHKIYSTFLILGSVSFSTLCDRGFSTQFPCKRPHCLSSELWFYARSTSTIYQLTERSVVHQQPTATTRGQANPQFDNNNRRVVLITQTLKIIYNNHLIVNTLRCIRN